MVLLSAWFFCEAACPAADTRERIIHPINVVSALQCRITSAREIKARRRRIMKDTLDLGNLVAPRSRVGHTIVRYEMQKKEPWHK